MKFLFDKLRCTSANEQALCFRFAVILHLADCQSVTMPALLPSSAQQSAKNKLQNRLNLINRTTLYRTHIKKEKENPSIGVLLCKDKDDEVVEYALSRSLSPTMVAEYQLCLPDKALLQQKIRELEEELSTGEL